MTTAIADSSFSTPEVGKLGPGVAARLVPANITIEPREI
jgi:hypothetical protein